MGKIKWTNRALKDLNSIFDYIASDSLFYAERFTRSLINSTLKLEKMPKSGRIIPEFAQDNLREIIYHNYRIVYKIINSETIDILSIIHSSRNFIDILN
jgi:toxin ParE1/3/4